MKVFRYITILLVASLCLASCSILVPKYATISNKPDLSNYKYVFITPASVTTSVSGGTWGNQDNVYGSTSSTSFSPSEVISGYFMKQGFVRIPAITEELKAQTLVVSYGEGGRKRYGLAYSQEVTLQVLDATTFGLICSSTAEGMGATEADDVRKATIKCLDAIFQ